MKRLLVILVALTILLVGCDPFGIVVGPVEDPEITYDSINAPTTVTITTATEGAEIYYTTDGTDPDPNDLFSRRVYSGPFQIYEPSTVKALAVLDGQDDSGVSSASIDVVPVSLSVGESHSFNGIDLTLDSIHWYHYEDLYGGTHETDRIVLQFTVENTTSAELSTNPIYSWGQIIESPGNTQLSSLYSSSFDVNNMNDFDSYSLASGAVAQDAALFEEASATATSFVFSGEAPYTSDLSGVETYLFTVEFSRSDIVDVAIP